MRFSLLMLGSAALLAGCTSKDSTPTTDSAGGTLVFALAGDAVSLYPPAITDIVGRMVQDQVFDRLAEIGPDVGTVGDKSFTPRLAQKWTWAPDSLSIAFSLDPRARWHDGKPVTAADVRFSLNAFKNPSSPVATLVSNLDSVQVKDSLTAVVWFKKRTPEQFYDLVYQVIVIPEHVYGAIPAAEWKSSPITRVPVGSGRFKFVRWEPETRIELIADTANYRGRAKLDRVIFTPMPDPSAAATQLLTGQVDFSENFPLDRAAALDTSSVARGVLWANLGHIFLAFNPTDPKNRKSPHPIFSDRRVRRALAMSVDRVAMLQNVFGNQGKLAHGPFPATAPFADTAMSALPYDTTAAKAVLDSAGWRAGPDGVRAKNGRPLRFRITVSPSPQRRRYSVLLQEQFRKIGVGVDIDQVDNPSLGAHQEKRDFDATLSSFVPDPSPSGLRQAWGTEGIGGQNFLGYSNKQFDALLDSATASFDAAKMKSYSSRAFRVVNDDAPAIFLYDILLLDGIHRRVITAPMRPDEWWANLADWSVPPDKRIDRDRIGLATAKP